ncbi:hypothetical protein PC41400_04280 [Paenibacillus chitinolyticus]|uniref:Uncharacterized protein n=2 Tax=Paenibacillus chitinolyticus TaxID=79263 RepID=A0A410WRI3_9BACL|nr:hypothetical protein PC41400_04280 [Paenibacillus chitinolyticus]
MKKMKTALASSLTLLSLVVSLAPVSASSNNRELEKEVAAGITGQERQIMLDVMKNLPKAERENVIYIDDNGQIHANKTELKDVFGKAAVSEENTVTVGNNETFTLPTSTDSPALNKNASVTPLAGYACGEAGGPYRRVFSNPGYSWWSGNVYLPSSTNNEVYVNNASSNDTPYIYTGGHASNGASEVDAGFQYSKTYNNWAHSIFTGGVYYHNNSFRFKAGQNLTFKFYVPADGQVALYAAGIRYDTNVADNYTVVTNASGWKKSGTGNELKRITAIASNASKPYNTGTYLKNVKWSNSMIGTSSTSNHQWLAADTGGYCTYPNSTQVSVNYVNAGEETVSINMN